VLPLSARVAGRTLLELLGLPEGGFRRQDVLAWLAAAPMLHEGRWAPTTAWERLSRDAAVVAGRADWDERLEALAAQQDRRAEQVEGTDDAAPWVATEARKRAERARSLRRFLLRIIDDLDRAAAAPRTWGAHAAWAQRWLDDLLGRADRRADWPDAERKAAERVELALARLAALDVVEGPVDLDVFARTLSVELDADLGRVGRLGEGVLVGSVEMGLGLDLDLVVLLGLAEGSFPSAVRDDSLLPDRERVVCGDELGLRSARVERQHRQLLGALAGAHRQVLCVPRGDLRRSTERTPSRWVLDVAMALSGNGTPWWGADLHRATDPWIQHVASFDAGLRHLAVPATEQEHRLRTHLAGGGRLTAGGDTITRAGAEVIGGRRSHRFTRFDGNLHGLPVPSPVATITSPTRLERWASCPFAHLVEDILGAAPVENPEEAFEMTPLEKGSLIHKVLEDFVVHVLALPVTERPRPSTPWSAEHHALIEQLGAERCDEWEAQGLTGRPIFWRRDRRRILADLHEFLRCDDRRRASRGASPIAAELGFGFRDPGEGEAVGFPLDDGRILLFRGRADRLDLAADGTLYVADYKTGKLASGYSAITDDDPIVRGTKLQLPVYGLAARAHHGDASAPVHAEYWFVTRNGGFKDKGYDVTGDVLARTSTTLTTIVTGIEDGIFPAHPEAGGSTAIFVRCHSCDPDGLGTVELRQHWARKRHDPLMARYAELAEPLASHPAEEAPA
jgi:RecB family exonuclease